MERKRLDVSSNAAAPVAAARTRFDQHVNECSGCRGGFCPQAESLWRTTCLEALHRQVALNAARGL